MIDMNNIDNINDRKKIEKYKELVCDEYDNMLFIISLFNKYGSMNKKKEKFRFNKIIKFDTNDSNDERRNEYRFLYGNEKIKDSVTMSLILTLVKKPFIITKYTLAHMIKNLINKIEDKDINEYNKSLLLMKNLFGSDEEKKIKNEYEKKYFKISIVPCLTAEKIGNITRFRS